MTCFFFFVFGSPNFTTVLTIKLREKFLNRRPVNNFALFYWFVTQDLKLKCCSSCFDSCASLVCFIIYQVPVVEFFVPLFHILFLLFFFCRFFVKPLYKPLRKPDSVMIWFVVNEVVVIIFIVVLHSYVCTYVHTHMYVHMCSWL